MNWVSRHAAAIEAVAAVVTAVVAVAALIGIKVQLDAADAVQRAQSAREAYRSHLALAASTPEFAAPDKVCDIVGGPKSGAYTAFVDHLLYSAEQMLSVEPGWEPTFVEALEPHAPYLCGADGPRGGTPELETVLSQFKAKACKAVDPCR